MLRSHSHHFGAAALVQPIAATRPAPVAAWRRALGATALAAGLTALPAYGQTFSTTTALPAAVADGSGGVCATPTVLTIPVSGLSAPLTGLSVTLGLQATWAGDVVAELVSPGGTASMLLFSRIGNPAPGGAGYSSNFAGNYTFADSAVINLWTVAAPLNTAQVIPPGTYATSPAFAATPPTPLLATFSGLGTAQINGAWTVRVSDCSFGDATSVTAASLSLTNTNPATPVPTLGEWSLMLLGTLAAALGMRRLNRSSARKLQ